MSVRGKWGLALALVVLSACRGSGRSPPMPPIDGGVIDLDTCPPVTMGTDLRLLTRAEYEHSVRDLLGVSGNPAKDFPREPLLDGLDNTASLLKVSGDGLARYLEAAEALAHDALTNHRARVLPCDTADDLCAGRFVDTFGRRAFRRPLSSDEAADLMALFRSTAADAGFEAAVEWTVESFLQVIPFLPDSLRLQRRIHRYRPRRSQPGIAAPAFPEHSVRVSGKVSL